MALHSSGLTQEQNLCVHFDGIKTNVKNKKGGREELKILVETPRKQNTKNVSKKSQKPVNGRKALGVVTNSVSQQQSLKKKNTGKQSTENISFSIEEEWFLHNHDECIKDQKKILDMGNDLFLKEMMGLDEDVSFSPLPETEISAEDGNYYMEYDIDELFPESEGQHFGQLSPICGSPDSPYISYFNRVDYDYFPDFILTESPKKSK